MGATLSALTCCHVLRERAGFAGKITIISSKEDNPDIKLFLQEGKFKDKWNLEMVNFNLKQEPEIDKANKRIIIEDGVHVVPYDKLLLTSHIKLPSFYDTDAVQERGDQNKFLFFLKVQKQFWSRTVGGLPQYLQAQSEMES